MASIAAGVYTRAVLVNVSKSKKNALSNDTTNLGVNVKSFFFFLRSLNDYQIIITLNFFFEYSFVFISTWLW